MRGLFFEQLIINILMINKKTLQTISENQSFVTRVEEYLSKFNSPKLDYNSDKEIIIIHQDYTKQYILHDYGYGPISSSIRSLNAYSRMVTGVSYSSLAFFNTKIDYINIDRLKTLSNTELGFAIANILGMLDYYIQLKSINFQESEKFINLCIKIGNDIKLGIFHKTNTDSMIRKACKQVIKVIQ